MSDSNCLFCKIVAGEIPATKVYENDVLLAFKDIHPQAPTHVLIIPKKHIATLDELSGGEDELLVGQMVLTATGIAREAHLDSGYRLVWNCKEAGGQEVFHIHLHLLGGRQMTWPPG